MLDLLGCRIHFSNRPQNINQGECLLMPVPAIWKCWTVFVGKVALFLGITGLLLPTVSPLPVFLVEVCWLPPQLHCSLKEEERRCDWQAAFFEDCDAYVPWAKLSCLQCMRVILWWCACVKEWPRRYPLTVETQEGPGKREILWKQRWVSYWLLHTSLCGGRR